MLREKLDSCGRGQGLTKKEIKKIRSKVPKVGRQEIEWVPGSDNEDAKKDVELKRKINLEKGRRVARENQGKGSKIWHTIKDVRRQKGTCESCSRYCSKRRCASSSSSSSGKTVRAPLTPLKSSTACSSYPVLRSHQQRSKLALHKNKTSASTTSTEAAATSTSLGLYKNRTQ